MSLPSPISTPEPWDTLTIGGLPFTGKFEFSGALLKRKLDHRHSAGRSGARIRNRGFDIAKIKLTLSCYEDRHFEELEAIVRLLFPREATTTAGDAYACPHPALAVAGITEVYGEGVGSFRHDEQASRWSIEIDLVEYRQPAAGASTATRAVRQRPDIAVNRTAFTGLQAAPANTPTPPSTAGVDPD